MGKKQHQKDKLYLTATEYTHLYGGRRPEADLEDEHLNRFRRLPFTSCCLSFQPFQYPYCTNDGHIFDLFNIVPFLSKFKMNPIDGKTLDTKSLTKLNFFKNNEGLYHCPVMMKTFTENSHIVAIKTTGNVYSYEAVKQLNLKPNYFKDLTNDTPFTKKDIIILQDPNNVEKQNASSFYHVVNKLKWGEEEELMKKSDPNYTLRNIDNVTKSTLDELSKIKPSLLPSVSNASEDKDDEDESALKSDLYSTSNVSASLTSTAMMPETKVKRAKLDLEAVMFSKVKKKGYVQLITSLGTINLELYCHEVPKTCYNFITLCKRKYYDKTIFHRLIKNFMIQGGDPTGTGRGGDSIWNATFQDEFKGHLVHQGRGVLSMANSGPNTNKSQFFITFRSCRHLDKKHTVFGKVVGGSETLDKMERVCTDDADKPTEKIELIKTTVYVDPFQEINDLITQESKSR